MTADEVGKRTWKFSFRHHWTDPAAEVVRALLLARHAR